MAIHYRTQGIILKKRDFGEADRIFTVFAKDFGKLDILGKAIRKIKSKLRAGAELFYLSDIEFIQGKAYKTLTDAILIDNFSEIKKDLDKLKTSYQLAEAADLLIKGEEKDQKIWQLLNETFSLLKRCDSGSRKHKLAYHYFLWNLFSALGYEPQLKNCFSCQKNLSTYFKLKYGLDRTQNYLCSGLIPENLYFSSKEGGIICSSCFEKMNKDKKELLKINPEIVKVLRLILKESQKTALKLKIDKDWFNLLENLSQNYLDFVSSNL